MRFKSKKALIKKLLKGKRYRSIESGDELYFDEQFDMPFRFGCDPGTTIFRGFHLDKWEEVKIEPKFNLLSILEKNTPVMVSNSGVDWLHSCYSHDGLTFPEGATSFSTGSLLKWNHIRLPTPKEAPLNTKIPHHFSLGEPKNISGMKIVVWSKKCGLIIQHRVLTWGKCTDPITHYMILEK